MPSDATENNAAIVAERFDEELYLRLNPDVRIAVLSGVLQSGREHYERFGRAENRAVQAPRNLAAGRVAMTGGSPTVPLGAAPHCVIDEVKLSASGGIYISGWANDAGDRLESITLYFSGWAMSLGPENLTRIRRLDVEAEGGTVGALCGFWGFVFAARKLPGGMCNAVVRLKSGIEQMFMHQAVTLDDGALRRDILGAFGTARYAGNPYFDAMMALDPGIGAQLVDFNKTLTARAAAHPYVARFGRQSGACNASVIVCLHGRPEYLFLQAAAFSPSFVSAGYEIIYVCNSPDLAEAVLNEARRSALIYGLDLTVVIPEGNCGFGVGCNLGAAHARSRRLVFMNPDVFPAVPDWGARHASLVAQLPPEQTRLFGVTMNYDDGALMHAGMYITEDRMPNSPAGRRGETVVLRVEHYGKGAPPETQDFIRPRPVLAVTGALISIDANWFETLEGFSNDYIFGHFEDADLCLKSLQAGSPAWLHDARLYHLEGKGGARAPEHEGGAIVNRWLFSHSWASFLREGLIGPLPAALGTRANDGPAA